MQLSENISNYISATFGSEFLNKYLDYIGVDQTLYIRISRLTDSEKIISGLAKYGIELTKVENIPNAYIVNSGSENISKTIEFALGKYYIQSLSSMIPALILNPGENDRVLDLCAAPGSKTTQIAEIINGRGTLVANEISIDRVKSLVYNMDKMNLTNMGVIRSKGELLSKTFENYFDKILVDAPCSALGILQKKGEVSNWWEEKRVEKISELQLRLLISAIKMLKVNGEIVYSTCTMTVEENEMILNKVLKNYPVELVDIELPIKAHPAMTTYGEMDLNPEIKKARRIIPWEINSEGFFIAKLRKLENTIPPRKEKSKERGLKFIKARSQKFAGYIQDISEWFGIPAETFDKYKYLMKDNDIFFIGDDWDVTNLNPFLRIGTRFGLVDKRDRAHLHTLSAQLLGDLATQNIVELETEEELQKYLDGGIIKKVFNPFGQKIIKFNGFNFGTAIAFRDGLKSQFPRPMRTHEIAFPEK